MSENHFRFFVSSKQVGFYVYHLRRVTTKYFDIFFHLWNNGTLHWEREKHAWEIEQAKEWTEVLSKISKRAAKKKPVQKRVHFAKNLVQHPSKLVQSSVIQFGSFSVDLAPPRQVKPILKSDSNRFHVLSKIVENSDQIGAGEDQEPDQADATVCSEISAQSKAGHSEVIQIQNRQPTGPACSRCLAEDHPRRYCFNQIRCKTCFSLGHVSRKCPSSKKIIKPI